MRVRAQKFFEVVKRLELHSTTLSVLDLLMLDAEDGIESFCIDVADLAFELDLTRVDVEQALSELIASGLLVQTGARHGIRVFQLDPSIFPRRTGCDDFSPPKSEHSRERFEFVDV